MPWIVLALLVGVVAVIAVKVKERRKPETLAKSAERLAAARGPKAQENTSSRLSGSRGGRS